MSTPLSYAVAMPRGAEPGRLLDVRLVFFATVYALVSVATFCMWLGEDEAFPYPWLVLSAALAALVLTDGRQLLAIPPVLTGWLALGVLALFAWEELREWQFDPVMPLGHLLIYLELSFFFHRKKAWYLWAMVFMSFLQVVIAALHSNKLLFGVLLALYVLLGLVTLTQFLVVFELERHGRPGVVPARRLAGAFSQSLRSAAVILGIAAVLFLFIPRHGQAPWTQSQIVPGTHLSGFDEQIQLGQLGQILENDDEVMTVRLFDEMGHSYKPADEPLWRGVALTAYQAGRWRRITGLGRPLAARKEYDGTPTIRQEIRLQHLHREILFGMRPVLAGATRDGTPLELGQMDGTLIRPDSVEPGTLQYTIDSARDERTEQPGEYTARVSAQESGWRRRLTQVPEPLRGQLREYNASLGISDEATSEESCGTLVAHLRDSGLFTYTLEESVVDPSIDAVLDFLVNRKSGHCEYFASSLALMLRAQNVPARVVNGFKGGDWNELLGKFYVVRQKHAHSWVEAIVGPPNDLHWVTLDPTPVQGRQRVMARVGGRPGLVRQLYDMSRNLWAGYVLNYNTNEQEATVYGPLRQFFSDASDAIRAAAHEGPAIGNGSFNWRAAAVASTAAATALTFLLLARRLLRPWSASPVLEARTRHAGGGWRGGWLAFVRRLLALLTGRARSDRGALAFYEKFVAALERHGLTKQPAWTPRQFARHAAEAFTQAPRLAPLAGVPDEVVDCLYRVRFGARMLSETESERIGERVRAVTAALDQANGRRRSLG